MNDQTYFKGIASRIAAVRREQKLTRPQMAEALNISYNAYTKYERALNFPSLRCQVNYFYFSPSNQEYLKGEIERLPGQLKKVRKNRD
jgi:DNA-binding XRE family transcriptional regulator